MIWTEGRLGASLGTLSAAGMLVAGLFWTSTIWSDWRLAGRVVSTGQAILEGRSPTVGAFVEEIAEPRLARKTLVCPADMRRALAIISLNRFETSFAKGTSRVAIPAASSAIADVRRALTCTPTDGFLWFALGWLTGVENSDPSRTWAYFRQSYRLAPVESWVTIRRNATLVPYLDRLPAPLASEVLEEFRRIVANGYYGEAFTIMTGPGWPFRNQLAASLAGVDLVKLAAFDQMLRNSEIYLAIPGVAPKKDRPWQR